MSSAPIVNSSTNIKIAIIIEKINNYHCQILQSFSHFQQEVPTSAKDG